MRPYITASGASETPLQGLFIVPVIAQRLASAMLVNRAFSALNQARPFDSRRDAVALALPRTLASTPSFDPALPDDIPSVDPRPTHAPLDQALARLPAVTLLYLRLAEDDHREVLPITPCDGIIEGLRTAREFGLHCEFVDADVVPSHLVLRNCSQELDWPDDGLALEYGAAAYLDAITPWLSQPPSRLEPIDTHREAYMTERVRHLATWFERVLLICGATHARPILELLRKPAAAEPVSSIPGQLRIDIGTPSHATRLHYLDDIPRLVELYERARTDGTASRFRKLDALVTAADDLRTRSRDVSFGVRNYTAFASFLSRRLAVDGRVGPRLDDVTHAARSCFGRLFSARLRRYLLGYYDDVDVDRIAGILEPAALGGADRADEDDEPRIVSRSCNPLAWTYRITIPDPHSGVPASNVLWPPYKDLAAAMMERALRMPRLVRRRGRTSAPFRGSLRAGLDLRRTLRSQLGPSPGLYVKQHRRRMRYERTLDQWDPVVWVFDAAPSAATRPGPGSVVTSYGTDIEGGYTAMWMCGVREDLAVIRQGKYQIFCFHSFGAVAFHPPTWTHDELRKRHGGPIDPRYTPLFRTRDPVLSVLDGEMRTGGNWLDALLQGAIAYARKRVVVVCPTGFRLPQTALAKARHCDIEIQLVPHSRFRPNDLQRLRSDIGISGPHDIPETTDRSDPELARQIIARFGAAVEAYW